MRVIAGFLGGQNFDSPRGHRTHPMSEKMRGAIFGALGDIHGLTVLDAFSGSGALVIEAISRGAESAIGVELDKIAYTSSTIGIEKLGISSQAHIVKTSVKAWSTRHQAHHFDLIFIDPPYDDIPYKDVEVMPRHLKDEGVLILSWPPKVRLPIFGSLEIVQIKKYGDSQLVFYRKIIA